MDYLVRCISDKANVTGLACVTTGLVQDAARLHGTSRTVAAALGRALTGALLMGALLKAGQRVALKFEGDGPMKKIIAEADSGGRVRGFPGVSDVEVPAKDQKLNVSGVLGTKGLLTVVKDLGLKEPYRGIVELQTGEVAEDIAYYLAESEQIPSAVGLGVFVEYGGAVTAAGGFLIQTLPSVGEQETDHLIDNIRKMPFVTELLKEGKTPEVMLDEIFSGFPYRILEKQNLSFQCPCSKEQVKRALVALGKDELQRLISEGEDTDVLCEYCRTRYPFTRDELEALLSSITPTDVLS